MRTKKLCIVKNLLTKGVGLLKKRSSVQRTNVLVSEDRLSVNLEVRHSESLPVQTSHFCVLLADMTL